MSNTSDLTFNGDYTNKSTNLQKKAKYEQNKDIYNYNSCTEFESGTVPKEAIITKIKSD